MRFDYESSWNHTYESFGARQRARLLQAKYDQNAINVDSREKVGSVIERGFVAFNRPLELPFSPPEPEAVEEGILDQCIDCYGEAKGG